MSSDIGPKNTSRRPSKEQIGAVQDLDATILREFSMPQVQLLLHNGGEYYQPRYRAMVTQLIRELETHQIITPTPAQIIAINSKPFDPAAFMGVGWSIWRGPADGTGLIGEEDRDWRALALSQIDPAKFRFETTLQPREDFVCGEERLRRLKVMKEIRADDRCFQTFWENKKLIPESMKRNPDGSVRSSHFDGTILRSPHGDRCVLFLRHAASGWAWGYRSLTGRWSVDEPALLLES